MDLREVVHGSKESMSGREDRETSGVSQDGIPGGGGGGAPGLPSSSSCSLAGKEEEDRQEAGGPRAWQ